MKKGTPRAHALSGPDRWSRSRLPIQPSIFMNKVELVEAVKKQLGSETSKADAEKAVTAVIHSIKAGVRKDKMVQLVGFGTFKVVERKARKGVNPKTLQQIRIPKSKTVKFVPGKDFKTKV
jgi:DNA-binding protein HU-beta